MRNQNQLTVRDAKKIDGTAVKTCLLKNSVPDPDPHVSGTPESEVWIRIRIQILLSSSKKNLDSYCFVTLDFSSLKNDVNVPSKSNKQKNFL
jgi:hypothetical protein